VEQYDINYPMLVSGYAEKSFVESVIKGLQDFGGYPTTIYIDRQGKVGHVQTGFWIASEPHKKWQLEKMESHIQLLLEK